MAERVLRDQCEHGRYDDHSTRIDYKWERCPGGREVTIDDESARAWAEDLGHPMTKAFLADLFDAALGVADESLTASRHYFDEAAKRDG